MKRMLSLILILALTLCTLTACSSGGETPKEKGLTDAVSSSFCMLVSLFVSTHP